jgi:hypothetical protein
MFVFPRQVVSDAQLFSSKDIVIEVLLQSCDVLYGQHCYLEPYVSVS